MWAEQAPHSMRTSKALTDGQLANLSRRFGACVSGANWRRPELNEAEPAFTGSVLLPQVGGMVAGLNTPGIVVRADGGVPTRPVSFFNVAFYPDLEIAYFDNRSLAVEVKFLRDQDTSGA